MKRRTATGIMLCVFFGAVRLAPMRASPQSTAAGDLIFPIVVNGSPAGRSYYQTIFTVLNISPQAIKATLQVYRNDGKPGGVFCSPLAPPPSRLTATLDPNSQFFQFTSADFDFIDGWARLSLEGSLDILATEEVTLLTTPPAPCLLVCNRPSNEKLSSAQAAAVKPAREFHIPVTLNPNRQTALALINPSETDAITVRVVLLDASGAPAKLGVPADFPVTLQPLQRVSKMVWQLALEHSLLTVIPPIPDSFQGSLVLTSVQPFAAGALHIMLPEGKFVNAPAVSP